METQTDHEAHHVHKVEPIPVNVERVSLTTENAVLHRTDIDQSGGTVVGYNPRRRTVVIVNVGPSNLYLSATKGGDVAGGGFLLAAGATLSLDTRSRIYGGTDAGGTCRVSVAQTVE